MNKGSYPVDAIDRTLNCIRLSCQKNPGEEDPLLASKEYGLVPAESIHELVRVISGTFPDAKRSLDVSQSAEGRAMSRLKRWKEEKFMWTDFTGSAVKWYFYSSQTTWNDPWDKSQ